jgi:hypothetical protein
MANHQRSILKAPSDVSVPSSFANVSAASHNSANASSADLSQ